MLEGEFLPYDLIVQILLRLPVRSLLQFKCVCKSWKTLISNPQFAKDHLSYSTTDTGTTKHLRLVSTSFSTKEFMSWPVKPFFDNNKSSTPLPPPEPIYINMISSKLILGSCNGLLCLYDFCRNFVTLWNPSTRLMSERSPSIFAAPRGSIKSLGFGYDQINDKYKLIVMQTSDVQTHNVIKVYNFGATNNSFATIHNIPFPLNTSSFFGKFVSGTLNWIVAGGLACELSKCRWTIFWFDLEKETYDEMLLPKQHSLETPVLGVLSSCLCVSFFDSYQTHWVVWSMKKHSVADSWTKFITIPLLNIYNPEFNLLYISENGVLLAICDNLFMSDPINGRFDYSIMQDKLGFAPHIYHESLVSPLC